MSADAKRKRASEEAVPDASVDPDKPTNRNIRLSDRTHDSWKLWCKVNRMSYEESIVFLLEQHPVNVTNLKKVYRGIK